MSIWIHFQECELAIRGRSVDPSRLRAQLLSKASEPANIERQAAEKLVIDAEITKGIEDRKKYLRLPILN